MDIKVMEVNDPEYPEQLLTIPHPPRQLYYAGDPAVLKNPLVAMVGSRRSTPYGNRMAGKIAARLVACGAAVVSGMAVGIDGMSHRGALAAGGKTVAVLGCGIDMTYPRANQTLKKEIIQKGLVLSEYPPGTRGASFTFPARNRIISGLAMATVVVEAGLNSGSLITAGLAEEQGRRVYGVPGNIDAVTSLGVNLLIRDGAIPLVVVEDLPIDLGLSEGAALEKAIEILGADEQALYKYLRLHGEVSMERLAVQLGFTPARLNGLVAVLEMKGIVGTALGKVFLLK